MQDRLSHGELVEVLVGQTLYDGVVSGFHFFSSLQTAVGGVACLDMFGLCILVVHTRSQQESYRA
jgi:hypothetical protein